MKTADKTKFQSVLASTLSVTAALLCMTALSPQTANAQTVTRSLFGCVSLDPRANAASGGFVVNQTCQQYFGAGATFPALTYRNYFDWYGVTIPGNGSGSCQANGQDGCQSGGLQVLAPTGSPQLAGRSIQFNYCLSGGGNGRGLFVGTVNAPTNAPGCRFIATNNANPSLINTPNNNNGGTVLALMPIALTGNGNFSASEEPTYAGTDVPLSQAEINTYQTNKLANRGNPIQLPAIIAPVAVSVNATSPGSGLRLSTADLCRIFAGGLTDYSQLTAPSTTGRSGPIIVVVGSGGSTNIFTSYLATACPQVLGSYYLTAAFNTFPSSALIGIGIFASTDRSIANVVASTVGAIGYNEVSYASPFALGGGPLSVQLPNPAVGDGSTTGVFVSPTSVNNTISATTGLAVETYATNPAGVLYPCVLRVAGLLPTPTTGTLLPTTSGYPINGVSNLLLYTNYDPVARTAITSVFNRLLGSISTGSPFPNDAIAQANGTVVVRSGTNATQTNALRASLTACVNSTVGNLTRVP
jgi:ABC-type phosphate transport system substrate-binding protein